MEPVVSIRHLNHAFGKGQLRRPVLKDISLDLNPGEIVILMGPSGSGKTTLLTLIGALRSQQEGSLKFLDQELLGASKKKLVQLRQQIGFIFQSHNLLDCLTAQENVRMSLKLHTHLTLEERKWRAIAILESVGLGEHIPLLSL